MDFGLDQARARVLDAMHTGKWDIVDVYLTRYAAAVRAEERYRAIGEAMEALRALGNDDGDAQVPLPACITAVERLR